jgi:hypothetical protein
VSSVRRYYLRKRLFARQQDTEEEVWKALQEAEPGTGLPGDFPFRATLADAGYSTAEDLEDACPDELYEFAGLMKLDAEAVIRALAELST